MDQVFNNREIATSIWTLTLLSLAFINKEVRESAKSALVTFCQPAILTVFAFMLGYVCFIVCSLSKIGLWNLGQLKNTIMWFIFVASVELFKANRVHEDKGYFKKSIKSHFKLLVVVDFIVAFQSFSLITELIIAPILILVVLMLAVSELEDKYKPVETIMSWLLSLFGIVMIGVSFYGISLNFVEFSQSKTLIDFITPIILSIFLLPFIFMLSSYMLYQNILAWVNIYTDNKSHRRYAKLKGIMHFRRDHKGLNDWLHYSCISDFESKKAIDESIIIYESKKSEIV